MVITFNEAFSHFVEWLKNFKIRPLVKRRVLYMLMREMSGIENYAKYRAAYLAMRGVYVEPSAKITMDEDSVYLVLRLRVLGVDEALTEKLSRRLISEAERSREFQEIKKYTEKALAGYLNKAHPLSYVINGDEDEPSSEDLRQGAEENTGEDGGGSREEGHNVGGAGTHGDNGGDRMKSAIAQAIERAITKKAKYDEEAGDYVIEDIGNIRYDDEMQAYIALARQLLNKPSPAPRPKKKPTRG